MILPGATLGVLGGGQLGRMFLAAARVLGYRVAVFDPDPHSPAGSIADDHVCAAFDDRAALARFGEACAAITVEFENVPADALNLLAVRCPVRPSARAVGIAQDRSLEKGFFRDHGFPVAPFALVRAEAEIAPAFEIVGSPALLKTARLGYDGKGQAAVTSAQEARAAFARFGSVPCVLEPRLALTRELSVVLARGADGQCVSYPVVENEHVNGILDTSIVPARVPAPLALRAQEIARALAQALDYVGVLAVELFVVSDAHDPLGARLLINEIAPRPHNSGHYTLDACLTSQFEQQVRALCGLPLGDTRLLAPAVMVNLLGDLWARGEPAWREVLAQPGAKLHLYGKHEARPGRKMGHYTCLGRGVEEAIAQAFEIKARLAPPYSGEARSS